MKASHLARLERLYRRRVPVNRLISPELARNATELSSEIRRRIGLVITRRGIIDQVIVGSGRGLPLGALKKVRLGNRFLRGVRLVQTHLYNEALTHEDLTDFALYRMDLVAGIGVGGDGLPQDVHVAHLLPPNAKKQVYETWTPCPFHTLQLECQEFVESLQGEMARVTRTHAVSGGHESRRTGRFWTRSFSEPRTSIRNTSWEAASSRKS